MIPSYDNPQPSLFMKGGAAMPPSGFRLLGPNSSHPEILYEENFLSNEACDDLIKVFDKYALQAPGSFNGDSFFDHRVIHFAWLPDAEETCKLIMEEARIAEATKLKTFFGIRSEPFADDVQLVRWLPGQPMPPHADNAHPDGSAHDTPHREHAAIVYLNDDFVGGYLYFDKLKVAVAPKKGLLIGFRGDMEHAHGVTAMTLGKRYTMPAWFTSDEHMRDKPNLQWKRGMSGGASPSEYERPALKLPNTGPEEKPKSGVGLRCYALVSDPPKLVASSPMRRWMDETSGRHAYRCLPMAIANSYGWELLSPCSFTVSWNGGSKREDLTIIPEDNYSDLGHFAESNFAHGIVTFHAGYLFQTDPGWHLVATGPFNSPKHGVSPLTGVIETDWLPYPFTMNWRFTEPGSIQFSKNEPFCLIYPVPQGALENITPEIHDLSDNVTLNQEHNTWRRHRNEFRQRLDAGEAGAVKEAWQKFYYKGEIPDSSAKAPLHVHKLRLRDPLDRRK